MNLPDPNLFLYEYWLEIAIASHMEAMGVIDVARQRNDGDLLTPRVEAKVIWDGMTEHRYTDKQGGVWFDMGQGKIALKCITRRNEPTQSHTKLVGLTRYAMNIVYATPGYTPGDPNPKTLSDRMPYHRIGRLVDTGATPSFTPNQLQDITALSFDFTLFIRQEKFPQTQN